MSRGYSFPKSNCEAPKCEEKATEQILLQSREHTTFATRQSEPIEVCTKHKKEFVRGKMFPAFNRLKNAERNKTDDIFTRKAMRDFKSGNRTF